MAFGSFDSRSSSTPMAEINMVPLIDIMLVLLVIFIIAAPLLTQVVRLNLPKATAQLNEQRPQTIEFSIDAAGTLYWNKEVVTRVEATQRFAQAGREQPQPEVHLRADESVAYRFVAQTLADASKAGLSKIGFISQSEEGH